VRSFHINAHALATTPPGTWPGKDLPALQVPSDTAWLLWHTDGTNTDWGWRLRAAGEVEYDASYVQLHWLSQVRGGEGRGRGGPYCGVIGCEGFGEGRHGLSCWKLVHTRSCL
jgi:hypothetical protein